MKFQRYIFLLLLFASSCKKIEIREPIENPETPGSSAYFTYITNEGNFQSNNSSISKYDPVDSDLIKDHYKEVNQTSLGDICQSMTITAERIYVVVNNSGKIEVLNRSDFRKINTITGLTSPRYIIEYGTNLFVSDLFENAVSVVNKNTGALTKKIILNGWTEEMVLNDKELYVTNIRTSYVYIIDVDQQTLKDSIKVGFGSSAILKANGKIWVLCQGDQASTQQGGLYSIDPATKKVTSSLTLPAGVSKLVKNKSSDILYYLQNGVHSVNISSSNLSSELFFDGSGKNLYGLGADPFNGDIYFSDAHDFLQEGTIYHYTGSKELIRSFKAGFIPGNFYFFQ